MELGDAKDSGFRIISGHWDALVGDGGSATERATLFNFEGSFSTPDPVVGIAKGLGGCSQALSAVALGAASDAGFRRMFCHLAAEGGSAIDCTGVNDGASLSTIFDGSFSAPGRVDSMTTGSGGSPGAIVGARRCVGRKRDIAANA